VYGREHGRLTSENIQLAQRKKQGATGITTVAGRFCRRPAERIKTEDDPQGQDFEVPLCDRALSILRAVIPKDAAPAAYVFAGQWSKDHTKPLGMNAVLHAPKAVYPAMITHGCRSSFRDWAGDETRFEREIAEMALAHKVGDETEQAYRRGNALKKRRQLMEAWVRSVGSTF
jgi:integrase